MQQSTKLTNSNPKTTCLSDYRLNRIEDLKELRARVGDEMYLRVWAKVKTNLDGMQPNQVFYFQKYIPDAELETFVKQACYYITQHCEWEFLNDYSAIRRTWQTLHSKRTGMDSFANQEQHPVLFAKSILRYIQKGQTQPGSLFLIMCLSFLLSGYS